MYNSVFFIGTAFAIHGETDVPLEPVSHGCVRIPMDIAAFFHTLVKVPGEPVIVEPLTALPGLGDRLGPVDHGQRAGQLDAAEGHRDHGDDLDDQQPAAGPHVLAEDGHPVAGADQRVAEGERRLDGDQRARPAGAFCSRNSAPTPAAAVAYSCQVLKNAAAPRGRAATALFISVAVSA